MQTNLIKAKMVETGFTQKTLASAMNMSTSSLNLKLTGKRSFDIPEIMSLCKILGITDAEEKDKIFLS